MQASWEPDFFIADWRVRPALGQLERGDLAVSIEARSLQVLACLARHAPDVVSKQRLIREVWGESFVSDEVLSHAIWELRKAFGDEARSPRFIQTIARKGYRLLAEVSRGAAPESLASGCKVAQYEILAPVGGGAMGEVYKAKDLRLGRVVALKFLPSDLARDPSARRRFLHEAQAVALLDHPNVATIYETGESEGGRAFLALAFYEGETLQQKLENGPLPLPEAVAIARQIARGLAAAHRRQIVHRDVKPSNIVVLPDGTVKLLDFGLAKMSGATTLTRLGSSPGTPAYKSPEQTRGEKVDPRSDLWALGVVLYEMVTGRVPFGGEYEQAVIYAILNEPPRPLDGAFPPELAEVVERALAKDPAARYATAEEMEADLACIPLGAGGEVTQPWPAPVRRWPRVKWTAAAALVVLVALSSLVGLWWSREHRWEFSQEVERLVEQGDKLEWQGDTKRILTDAAQTYERALALDHDNPLIQAQLAALLARLEVQFPESERRKKIQTLTAKALEKAPDEPMPWVAQAKLLLLEKKPQEAELAAREAIEQDAKFDRGYTLLGEALFAQGRLEESFVEFRRSTEVGQGYVRAGLVFAAKLYEVSRYDEAAAEFREVLRYNPVHPTAKNGLADIYLKQNRYLEAIPLFKEVFEATQDARSANSLGIAYSELGYKDDAIKAFSDAYRLDPHPFTARNLAETYENAGQRSEGLHWYALAISSFDHLLAVDSSQSADLLYGRSFCVAKLGRYGEALGNIKEAIRLEPKKTAFLFRAAQICAMAGHREEVYSWAQKAVQAGYSRENFRRDSAFQDFRDDPRFREILESAAR